MLISHITLRNTASTFSQRTANALTSGFPRTAKPSRFIGANPHVDVTKWTRVSGGGEILRRDSLERVARDWVHYQGDQSRVWAWLSKEEKENIYTFGLDFLVEEETEMEEFRDRGKVTQELEISMVPFAQKTRKPAVLLMRSASAGSTDARGGGSVGGGGPGGGGQGGGRRKDNKGGFMATGLPVAEAGKVNIVSYMEAQVAALDNKDFGDSYLKEKAQRRGDDSAAKPASAPLPKVDRDLHAASICAADHAQTQNASQVCEVFKRKEVVIPQAGRGIVAAEDFMQVVARLQRPGELISVAHDNDAVNRLVGSNRESMKRNVGRRNGRNKRKK